MKRATDYNVWGAQAGVDPEALRARDRQRSNYLWHLSTWLERRGYLSPQDAADTKSAIAANVIEHISQNQEAYNNAAKSGALDKWREIAAGYSVPGESAEGRERRHTDALRKTVLGALDIELAGNASPERLKEAANIYRSCFPREMATVQRAMGWDQAEPNDDDRRLREMTEDESQNAAAVLWA